MYSARITMLTERAKQVDRPGMPPAFIIEEEQLGRVILPQFPAGADFSFSLLLDEEGHVHIEFNHCAFDPAKEEGLLFKRFLWLMRPKNYYERIAPEIIAGSLLKSERTLVGGLVSHYYAKDNEVFLQNWGLLSVEQKSRKGVHLIEVFHELCRQMKIDFATTASAVPYVVELAKKFGWERRSDLSRAEQLKLLWSTFPVSLWYREIPLLKDFTEERSRG
jgi:hypothetical protein